MNRSPKTDLAAILLRLAKIETLLELAELRIQLAELRAQAFRPAAEDVIASAFRDAWNPATE